MGLVPRVSLCGPLLWALLTLVRSILWGPILYVVCIEVQIGGPFSRTWGASCSVRFIERAQTHQWLSELILRGSLVDMTEVGVTCNYL